MKNLRVKKENSVVKTAQHLPFFLLYYWRELQKVTNKQDLNPAKWLVDPPNVAQRPVDGVQKVGTQHTHFIDNQQFHILNNGTFGIAHQEMAAQGYLRSAQALPMARRPHALLPENFHKVTFQ